MPSLSLGIVGLPNVGKSTLFNALVKNGQATASNYPFCTIEPNVGIVQVPDTRLDDLANLVHPGKIIPAVIEFVDIAGIIKGASQGEGLGNKFLSHIREVAAVLIVVRCFEHPDVVHVHGNIDPKSDLETVLYELALADLETVQKGIDRYTRLGKTGDSKASLYLKYANELKECLDRGETANKVKPKEDTDFTVLRELQLLTAKPMLIVANVGESLAGSGSESIFKQYNFGDIVPSADWIIPISAKLEADLQELGDEEKSEFLSEYGLKESGLIRLVRSAYKLLNLSTYFTAGPQEVRAWTIQSGWTAPQAAGVIHTDFEKGFIRAEVINFQDYASLGSEVACKDAGKMRLEGKEYIVKDGDIMHFRFTS